MLAGASFGGIVAYEMLQQLKEKGDMVPVLAMFDTPLHVEKNSFNLNDASIIEFLLSQLGLSDLGVGEFVEKTIEEFLQSSLPEGIDINLIHKHINIFKANMAAFTNYKIKIYEGDASILLFDASERRNFEAALANLDKQWHEFLGDKIQNYCIEGNHSSMLKMPGVKKIARILQEQIAFIA